MKFDTMKEAKAYATRETYFTKVEHEAVKTFFWQGMKKIPCYTIRIKTKAA